VQKIKGGFVGIDGQYDIVRATFTDGSNVPRIPPQRLGGGVYWRSDEWYVRVGLLHAFAQNNSGQFELAPTPGYNLLKAEVSRTVKFKNDPSGLSEATVGAVGNNLLNAEIRNATSFTKYEVLQPGANVRLFAALKF
jgi:iron complex outermembrane receptor protein